MIVWFSCVMAKYFHYYYEIGHALKQIDVPECTHGLARLLKGDNVSWRWGAVGAYAGIGAVD